MTAEVFFFLQEANEKMEIQSLQHAINRKRYLERILSTRPDEQYYSGDSDYANDAVESENRHNEMMAESIKEEIKKCDEFIKTK